MSYQRTGISEPGLNMDQVDKGLEELSDRQLATYAAQFDHTRLEGRAFEYLPYDVQRAMRAGNAIAKRARLSEKDAARKAEMAKRTAENEVEITDYLDSVRKAWAGSEAEWRSALPGIKQRYLVQRAEKAAGGMDELKAQLLASGQYTGL